MFKRRLRRVIRKMGKIYVVHWCPRGIAGYDGDIEKEFGDLREARKYLEKICDEWDLIILYYGLILLRCLIVLYVVCLLLE